MIKKRLFTIAILLLCHAALFAQADSSHLRISLLTCGAGDEIWETFGHTGVRVIDSVRHTDEVFNYGTFDGFDKNFELKFMQGKLPYYLSIWPYNSFMEEYVENKRSVQEQVIALNGKQKEDILSFMVWNSQPQNKYYKYDFFFDNCATRIRDIFPKTFGEGFKYGEVRPQGKRLSFRNIINQYFYKTHWERFGINILLGSRIDKIMTNEDIMFLPDYLRDGVGSATVNGEKVATPPMLILAGSPAKPAGINWALLTTCLLAILTIAGLSVRSLAPLGRVMTSLMLFITGFLGCLILVMWFATDHQGCQNNYNLLWALPTNIIFLFMKKGGKGRYAIIAIMLIIVSLVLHILKVQELPILELSPILISLLFIYGMIYKRNHQNPKKPRAVYNQ